ncbi:MAG: WG repeat-containing protein, partial [Alistipes shahii]
AWPLPALTDRFFLPAAPHLAEYRILRDELRWTDPAGRERRFDLALQHLPAGKPFAEALHTELRGAAARGARHPETTCGAELPHSHNLRAGNLRAGRAGGSCRCATTTRISARSGDGAAFESLREQVRRTADLMCVGDTEAVYTPHRRLTGHRWTSHVFEGLVCVEDDEGFGFVDTENNPVIRPQYTWAGDFREGRAEVETPSGMGLIDRQGRYVIPPEYEIVDYAPAESVVRVRKDGRWAEFDYLGRRLTEFGTNND